MKKFLTYMFFVLVIPSLLLTSCKKDEEAPNKHQVLVDYLKSQTDPSFDLPAMHATGWAVPALTLNNNFDLYYIIDLRAPADFNAARITGAVNATLTTLLTQAAQAPANKVVLLVCYSGQTAAFAVPALRMSGYRNAGFLKWGMSAWNSSKDVWTAKIANIATTPSQHANWQTYSADPASFVANVEKSIPYITSNSNDGAVILRERIAAVLAEGTKFVQPLEVLTNPGNYFVNNYWTVTNVTGNGNGHIRGAYRINPMTLVNNEYKFLDPSKQVVTYCWTGQTSAAVTFYLRVLGYDAVGMQWGANGLVNSLLTSNKWPEGQQNYPMVP